MTGRVNRRDAETQRIDFLAEVDEENEGERANREKEVRLRYPGCYEGWRLAVGGDVLHSRAGSASKHR